MIKVMVLNSVLVGAAFFEWIWHVLLAQAILQKHLIALCIRRMKKMFEVKVPEEFFTQNQLVSIYSTCVCIRSFHLSVPHFPISTTSSSFVFRSLADMNAILSCRDFIKGS